MFCATWHDISIILILTVDNDNYDQFGCWDEESGAMGEENLI